jgi:signal transduction histidine kinase
LRDAIGPDDPKGARRAARGVRSSDRLAALIESLLDVSRIATGRLVLKRERLDLSEETGQVVDSLRGAATKAGCDLSFAASGPIWGWWDRLRMDQVVMNLLSNALKYGAGAPIRVAVSVDADHAVIEVADEGPGIPERDLGRIFDRFERAAPVRHFGGLGLGLYVARQIVNGHGGTISARNLPDRGSCFTVRLPIADRATGEVPVTVMRP